MSSTSGSRLERLPQVAMALFASLLIGCGERGSGPSADDDEKREAPTVRTVRYSEVTAVPLGSSQAVVERRLGAPSPDATERFAVTAREREACTFYPLTKDPAGSPDAVMMCFDRHGILQSTSTLYAGRQRPEDPADAGPRDKWLAKPSKMKDRRLPGQVSPPQPGRTAPPPQP